MRGGTNLRLTRGEASSSKRRVMTVPLLRIIGHNLTKTGWSKVTVQSVWAASLVAFFGTFRMGELLAPHQSAIDGSSTLTWAGIKFREDGSILVHIKMPKMGTEEGEFVDLFPFSDRSICPVLALRKQKLRQEEAGLGFSRDPVFALGRGKFLTVAKLNSILRILLKDQVDFKRDLVSCHSFRAGLPSLIAKHPELMSSEDIKGWGRWSSEAYQRYTRLRLDQKKTIFNKIARIVV